MERQALLTGKNPPQIVAVFDEYAIRRPIGTPEVRRAQLHHLCELASLPDITMQIVPSGAGAYAGIAGAFTLLSFDEAPSVVYIEGHAEGQLLELPQLVRKHSVGFNLIRGAAMSADESLKLLRAAMECP